MIGRAAVHAVATLAGVAVGATLVLAAVSPPGASEPSSPPQLPTPTSRPAPTGHGAPLPETSGSMLVVWTAGALPDGFASAAAAVPGIDEVAEVAAGRLDLTGSRDPDGAAVDHLDPGWAIPLDAIAVEPTRFAGSAPTGQRPVLERLEPGTVLLGETSASLRRIGVGGRLMIGGDDAHVVVGIVDDAIVGAAEVVLHRDDPLATRMPARYLLLRYHGQRTDVDRAMRGLAGELPLRTRAPGETPYLRHGDAVLPQAIVKQRFGEFHYRPPSGDGREFDVDPGWADANLVTRRVPILGPVTCHRAAIDTLATVLTEIERRGHAHTIDPDGYEGCWNPRLIAADGDLSRHSWGIAVDLNAHGNPTGTASGQAEVLVELFTDAGWGWGGTWLVPDPMHFELVAEPSLPLKVRP